MVDLLERKLIFVTGKGGVGKTTIAAALAWLAAGARPADPGLRDRRQGRPGRLLRDGADPLRGARDRAPPVGHVDGYRGVAQAVPALQLKLPLVARIGPLAKMFDFVASAAPGVKEIVTVGKLCWEVKEQPLRHWSSSTPRRAGTSSASWPPRRPSTSWCRSAWCASRPDWMLDILDDPATTGLVVVATPAEMPVSETLELTARLRSETSVDLAAVVVNRVLPELFGRGEEEVFERLAAPRSASPARRRRSADATGPIMEAARLTVTMRRSRTEHLETLREAVDPSVPLLYVPYLFFRSHGLRATHQLADALSGELGY